MPRDPKLQIVEDTYDFERPQTEWLGDLAVQLGGFSGARSGYVYELARVDGRPRIGRCWFENPQLIAGLLETWAELPNELSDVFMETPPMQARTSAEVLHEHGIAFESTPLQSLFATFGFADVFAIHAISPSGTGLMLGMCLERHREFEQAERDAWSHVAAHVAAGVRLRQRLGSDPPIDHAEAVLRPDGKLEHVTRFDESMGELLREAVVQVERVRSREHDAHAALDLWKGLVDGRWSLLDHYEGGGRRYYVAVRNSPEAAKAQGLTRREAEIVAHLASGTSTKATAYALGLDAVTIRSHLRSALAKLGLGSRTDLIGLRARLLGQADAALESP